MKHSNFFKRTLSLLMCLLMVAGLFTVSAAAYVEGFVSETHDVFSRKTSTIAPGVTQDVVFAYAKDGKQMAYYVATADINRDDVAVYANYTGNQCTEFAMSKLTDQMAAAQERNTTDTTAPNYNPYYTAVAGVNADFYNMSTGQPTGAFVMEGTMSSNKANNRPFFAIFEDGYAYCGANNTEWDALVKEHGAVIEAVGGSQMLVKNGKDSTANASGSYNTDRHSRTCVGVTADGQVVMMVLDGRQEPFSCGGTMHELAQIMMEAGCVTAINLDGGGSTTFAARQEGENNVSVVNRPSDGSERAISSSLLIVSTAAPSDIFDRAVLTAENEYVTPYSTVNVTAAGVSPAGTAAEIPENATWQLEDPSIGTVADGVFTANGNTGAAVVQLVVDGAVVGETTINVVIPDITFDSGIMTVPYNKTFKLAVSGTTNGGMNKVALKDSDLVFELSDPKMGTIDGVYYTTCDDSAGVTGGTITVKCAYDDTKTATATVNFGKASVIAEDFEDGDITGWSAKSGYANPSKGDPVLGRFERYDLNLVDAETGKVRNGNYALEIVADFTSTTRSGYKAIKYSFPAIDLSGATTFGMWMYLPVQDVHNLEFDIGGYEYYIEDDANVSEEGWYYVTAPAATVGSSVSSFTIYMTDPDETYSNIFNKYSIYVDDLTIDYSNATEDREIPGFTKVNVVTGLDAESAINGQVFNSNTLTVKAYAAENTIGNYTGLDTSTARVYVDGVKLADSKFTCDEKGIITVGDLTLSNGTHTLRFEIDDKAGNTGFVTKQIVINEENGDVYVARRSNAALPLAGSIEYFDVIAENIENVDEITLAIDLDNVNIWELEGADVAYGFTMDYTIDESFNTAYITITKTGEPALSGEAVIAALPVRVWMSTGHLDPEFIAAGVVTDNPSASENFHIFTPEALWQTDGARLVEIEFRVLSGAVDYADGSSDTFSGKEIDVITENNRYRIAGYYNAEGKYVTGNTAFCMQGKKSAHLHTEVAIADKAATCTETGYTDRTFCEVCNSVVEWGTTVDATGHSFGFIDGVLSCTCGELYNGVYTDGKTYVDGVLVANGWNGDSYFVDGVALKGIQKLEGVYYDFGEDGICENQTKFTGLFYNEELDAYSYSKLGNLTTGWVNIDDEWYYFFGNGKAASGLYESYFFSYGVTYEFEENGKLTTGVWHDRYINGELVGTMYFYGPTCYKSGWQTIDGNRYFFDGIYRAEGPHMIMESNAKVFKCFVFDENGVYTDDTYTGFVETNGDLFYVEDNIARSEGMFKLGDDYYYAHHNGKLAISETLISRPNGYVASDVKLPFEANGRLYNGIYEENGDLYYYVMGVKQGRGLYYNEQGDYYVYVKSTGTLATGEYEVKASGTNGLLDAGYYLFDSNGKMMTGVVEENGELYFYRHGVKQGRGVHYVEDGDYYVYVRSTGTCAVGYYEVKESAANGLLNPQFYMFGDDGKLLEETGVKSVAGNMYYFIDGAKQGRGLYYNAEEDYYVYVKSNETVATGRYYVNATNGLVDPGYLLFDENGYSVTDVVSENGKLYYYENGIQQGRGVYYNEDGDYYVYVKSDGTLATGMYAVKENATNGLIEAGTYLFDENGKTVSDVVVENGSLYYYQHGIKQGRGMYYNAQGNFYVYVKSNGTLATGNYYVNATNDLLPKATYDFGTDGKLTF